MLQSPVQQHGFYFTANDKRSSLPVTGGVLILSIVPAGNQTVTRNSHLETKTGHFLRHWCHVMYILSVLWSNPVTLQHSQTLKIKTYIPLTLWLEPEIDLSISLRQGHFLIFAISCEIQDSFTLSDLRRVNRHCLLQGLIAHKSMSNISPFISFSSSTKHSFGFLTKPILPTGSKLR